MVERTRRARRGETQPAPSARRIKHRRSTVDPLHAPFDHAARSLRARRPRLLPRAAAAIARASSRYVASLDVPRGDPREVAAPAPARVLDQRLQRLRDRHRPRPLSDSRPSARSIRPTASDRLPAPSRSCRTAPPDARSRSTRSRRPSCRRSRIRGCSSRSAAARWAAGGWSARSITGDRLDQQLQNVASECVTRQECARVDVGAGTVAVTPIFSWRQAEFIKASGERELRGVSGPQPARARDPVPARAAPAAARAHRPRGQHLHRHVPALRLAPERPHRRSAAALS